MADIKWIKITTDIFDDEKILLIESMPDADALIVIWFKLLCLAGKQNNSGVFTLNDKIPYTDEMLATIFRRPTNTVRLALQTFEAYGMIDVIDGVITIPNWEKHQNIDALDKMREQTRERVARHREKQKAIGNVTSNVSVTECNAIDKNRKEKKRIEKNREDNTKSVAYFPNAPEVEEAFLEFIKMRKTIKAPMTDRAIDLAIKSLDKLSGGDNDIAVKIINQSILNNWKGFYQLKDKPATKEIESPIVDKWANA